MRSSQRLVSALNRDRVASVLWAALLLTVPFTSHPWITRVFGRTAVAPLSVVPLVGLVVVWLVPHLVHARRLPEQSVPLILFAGLALLSSGLAVFLPLYPAYEQSVISRELRSLVTLGVGVSFYLVSATWPASEARLRSSLRWLSLGGVAVLIYASVQILLLPQADYPVPQGLVSFHRLFSIRDPFRTRVTGFAYEPSWLGDQLVILYLPIWLSSVIARAPFMRPRASRPTIELGLLLWGMVVLFFSFARLATFSSLLILATLALLGSMRLSDRLAESPGATIRLPATLRRGLAAVAAVALLAGMGIGLVAVAAQLDERVEEAIGTNLKDVFESRHPWPYKLANELQFAERLVYWESGFRIFSRFPLFGVGLGNTGFLMRSTTPAFGFFLPEVIRAVHLDSFGFPNVKSLWVRLLSETGIVGFGAFVTWLAVVGAAAAQQARWRAGIPKIVALAALIALLAQVSEGFSLDTFALPQLWIVLGLATAGAVAADSATVIDSPAPTS